MTVLAGAIFSSCTNEDIEVTTVGKLRSIHCTVNMKSMYEEFELDKDISKIFLAGRSAAVGAWVYLYDSKGKLVECQSYSDYAMNNANISFKNLPEDEYTLIAVETLVNPDKEDQLYNWRINDEEDIKNIKIQHYSAEKGFDSVLGIVSQTFEVKDNDPNIMLIPKGVGSLIFMQYANAKYLQCYDEETHPIDKVGLGTDKCPDYYLLDPSLAEMDRLYFDPEDAGYFTLRGACNVDFNANDDEIQEEYALLYVLDPIFDCNFSMHCSFYKEEENWYNVPMKKYSLDKRIYYGAMYYANNTDQIYADLFEDYDECMKFFEYAKSLNVVESTDEFYAPYIDWSVGSVKAVRDYMSNCSTMMAPTFSNNVLTYVNNDNTEMYDYHFATAINGLMEVDYTTTRYDALSLADFLTNTGFDFINEYEGGYLFASKDETTMVTIVESQGVSKVVYTPMISESARKMMLVPRNGKPFIGKRFIADDKKIMKTSVGPKNLKHAIKLNR